ncbi:FkbM family methyltransferase [Kordia sp. YSTF-M3]|uniref:FkbM family methyltransferase n=1 Tax=Kordia aestuariivivens TaxID=2759037 RepID=A0ABR7QDB5_9FLAO|nr:FkbM family methyltransferase [Kordia aestuariivivens]MBC8756381.1 FkbM family methyltransferase [Kordia aestuariivivens]
MNLLYRIIYQSTINRIIRNINYFLAPLLPSKIKIHPSGKMKVSIDKNHGSFILKTNQTSYISREIFWEGALNFEYSPIFIGLIKKMKLFIDIGSNIGYYSILGSKVNPELITYAFEPSRGANFYLSENVKLNNLSNRIFVESSALMDASGEIDFYEIRNKKYPSIYNLSGEHNIGTKTYKLSQKTKVKATTLDAYFSDNNINALNLIKLDTEGAEAYILKGAHEVIKQHQPIIICELLFNKIEKELEMIMLAHAYKFYAHTEKGLKLLDSLVRDTDNGVRDVFFVPLSKMDLIEEWIVD